MVAVTVVPPDLLTVSVDGVKYQIPWELSPLHRDGLGRLIDHLCGVLNSKTFTVEVTELDGHQYTETITPPVPAPGVLTQQSMVASAPPNPASSPTLVDTPMLTGSACDVGSGRHAAECGYAKITASGFVPGEPVGLAVLITEFTATETGTVHNRVPAWLLDAGQVPEVVLVGRISGTWSIHQPPIHPVS